VKSVSKSPRAYFKRGAQFDLGGGVGLGEPLAALYPRPWPVKKVQITKRFEEKSIQSRPTKLLKSVTGVPNEKKKTTQ